MPDVMRPSAFLPVSGDYKCVACTEYTNKKTGVTSFNVDTIVMSNARPVVITLRSAVAVPVDSLLTIEAYVNFGRVAKFVPPAKKN